VAWVRSRKSGSWLRQVRRNWAALKRSKRCTSSLAIWMYEVFSQWAASRYDSRIIQLSVPQVANDFSYHISKGTFTVFGKLCGHISRFSGGCEAI